MARAIMTATATAMVMATAMENCDGDGNSD
jgi:hypothetical protein